MKLLAVSMMALAGLTVTAMPAFAQDDIEFSGNVALTTNYVFRGITQSDNGPAIQGGFDAAMGGFYVGTWASSVDFKDDTTLEIDVYAGYAGSITETLGFDVGVIYYAYPDSPEGVNGTQDFTEVYAGLSNSFGVFDAGVTFYYSPEFYGETGESYYTVVNASVPLNEYITASAAYGISEFSEDAFNTDYQDYNVGVSISDYGFDFDLRYFDTVDLGRETETVVFSIARSL